MTTPPKHAANTPHEEGEPETVFDPVEPLSPETVAKLAEHCIYFSEWQPKHAARANAASTSWRKYPTELVDCDRCDGMGEVEDDLWVWTRCYSCWGSGQTEVCAQCRDSGEECGACGC